MKSEELRLGNWVNSKFPMQVTCIYKDEILCSFEGNEADPFEFDPKDLEGIPLTDEWLLKFGFDKEIRSELWFRPDFWVQEMLLLPGSFYHNGLEIKYVHQLQNLYFALTEKEL